jgi:hypothetical protein
VCAAAATAFGPGSAPVLVRGGLNAGGNVPLEQPTGQGALRQVLRVSMGAKAQMVEGVGLGARDYTNNRAATVKYPSNSKQARVTAQCAHFLYFAQCVLQSVC